jgi:ketosteroid isomerase-like protein
MSINTMTIDFYMEGFRRDDRQQILSCLTPDVEWLIPGVFHVTGRDAFNAHIVDEGFTGRPNITVTRTIESGDVVVTEGSVRANRTDGSVMSLMFCDVFEMRDGKIAKVVSYLMVLK